MDLGLKGRTAVVLGSTSGLGFAVARALLEEGARVAISGRDPRRLAAAMGELAEHGERALGEVLDVGDRDRLRAHLANAAERLGPIAVLVTNSGGPRPATALEVNDEGLDESFDLLVRAMIHAVEAVLPGMRALRWGRIVGLTSIAVRQPIPTLVYSNLMRSGLTAYFKSLAGEVAKDGVLVNTVCTGLFATDRLEELFAANAERRKTTLEAERAQAIVRVPLGRLGYPCEFGAFVAFLCSERCSYLTGTALPYDGGANTALF